MVVAVLPGRTDAVCMDSAGQGALAILRHMGMPALLGIVCGGAPSGAASTPGALKERAAAKKRAITVLDSEVHAGTAFK